MTQPPLRLYRAVYRDQDQVERNLDMYARDAAHATSQATYLIATDATLVRVFHNPDCLFMIGFYFLCTLLIFAFALAPEWTQYTLTKAFLKMELWIMNLRLKWAAWCMYRALVKMSKRHGFPEPGPFVFVDLWDRG